VIWVVLILALFISAVFSGSETGLYLLSQPRLDVDARAGSRAAKLMRYMLRNESAVLVTILIGNNLALEVLTWTAEALGDEVDRGPSHEVFVALLLTPIVFLFAEALPKDLFRRRPHASMAWTVDFLLIARFLLWPAERVLSLLAKALEFAFGLRGGERYALGTRESVERLLSEGTLLGALEPGAEELARNALELRHMPVEQVMTAWSEVVSVSRGGSAEEAREVVAEAQFSRLPVTRADGEVTGYVHQLDVLGALEGSDPFSHEREILSLQAGTPVDLAIARLRLRGARMAIVGAPEAPLGLVALKDLLEEISGDLGSW
jgi:CBS domain containing-hemolysin-like protein